MKNIFVFFLGAGLVLIVYWLVFSADAKIKKDLRDEVRNGDAQEDAPLFGGLTIFPVSHASVVLEIGNIVVYVDPVGSAAMFGEAKPPTHILLTDIHDDHLSVETLERIVTPESEIVAPRAVYDMLPPLLRAQTEVLANDETSVLSGLTVHAVPMYNLPERANSPHTKGRGNGYVIERQELRVYVAGDTSNTPEMRALRGIDVAFVPMNAQNTMSIEEAAEAVLAFAPREVYPYQYRETDGFADVRKFKELVDAGAKDIEVVLINWYPDASLDSI
jgi:L-ascorbate metabolism protein UlaG (beta-lactamase superfamily)